MRQNKELQTALIDHFKNLPVVWLYHGKPYESKAPTGEYTLKTTDRSEISIFPSPLGDIKLPEGSKQHALTDRSSKQHALTERL